MPNCIRCGRLYHARDKAGVCDSCATVFGSGQIHLPDTKKVSRGRYQQEVEKASSAKMKALKTERGLGFGLSLLTVFFLWIVGSVLAYRFLDFSKHSIIWSISIFFFVVGLFMVLNRRISWSKLDANQLSASIDAKSIRYLPYIVGGFWMLPILLCALYYSLSAELPPDRALWFVGSALGAALLAEIICLAALSSSPSRARRNK